MTKVQKEKVIGNTTFTMKKSLLIQFFAFLNSYFASWCYFKCPNTGKHAQSQANLSDKDCLGLSFFSLSFLILIFKKQQFLLVAP